MPDRVALKVTGIDVLYKDFQALWDVSIEAAEGEIISVIGANGSGKSTLLNTISGLLTPARGEIEFLGDRIDGQPPYETVERGISLVPEALLLEGRAGVQLTGGPIWQAESATR